MSLLAVGFLPPPLGGISVSFKTFCDLLSTENRVVLTVINLSGVRGNGSFFKDSFKLTMQIWRQTASCDVVTLYCATPQIPTVGLLTLAICRIRQKPFILRKAAGIDHRSLGHFFGSVADYVVRHADMFLAETKRLAEACRSRGIEHVEWFPTNRPSAPLIENRAQCRNFVFIGQVRPSKGIAELIAAADSLPKTATVDVYGPFYDGFTDSLFQGHDCIKYRGILDPENVVSTLREYDAFVLPSKALTEGYPGAILEAFSVGLPVISTTVGGIPEIVNEQCGILVEPEDVDGLAKAMLGLINDETAYQKLCRGAREARQRFSAEYWTDWMVNHCIRLTCQRHRAPGQGSH